MKGEVLITGASGVLGRAIVGAATAAGVAVRQGVRDLAKAAPGGTAVRLDYADAATIAPAVAGISGLLLMAPPLDANAPAEVAPVIAAAKAEGVRQIVFISAFGVNHNEQAALRVVEHMVMESGVACTILRPNFFMENFSAGFLAGTIRNERAIYLAAGDGKTSFIAAGDIASAAIAVFQRRLTGEFDLTGPEALDHFEVARIIGEVSGRPVTYHPLTEEQMITGVRAAGTPESAIAYLTMIYGAVRAGYAAAITVGVRTLTGREPVSFAEFAKSVSAAWR